MTGWRSKVRTRNPGVQGVRAASLYDLMTAASIYDLITAWRWKLRTRDLVVQGDNELLGYLRVHSNVLAMLIKISAS